MAPPEPDAFSRFDDVRPSRRRDTPWREGRFEPDLPRLAGLVAACAAGPDKWRGQEGGALGLALDLWIADELRRAGYEPDAVWPRETQPRVLPASLARTLRNLPQTLRPVGEPPIPTARVAERVAREAGRAMAVVHGEFFPKQIDVLVADWDRGVELMVSTKSMVSSFANNLKSRWEEFVGDLRNIRGRYPLATLGVFFLADVGVLDDSSFPQLIEMLQRLRRPTESGSAYDATGLVIAAALGEGRGELRMARVPEEIAPGRFFGDLIDTALTRLPKSERQAARDVYGTSQLPTAESQVLEQQAPTGDP